MTTVDVAADGLQADSGSWEWSSALLPPAEALVEWLSLQTAIRSLDLVPVCATTDPEAWYAVQVPAVAVSLCGECPVADECAAYAVAAREPFGIWGGTTPRDRRKAAAL